MTDPVQGRHSLECTSPKGRPFRGRCVPPKTCGDLHRPRSRTKEQRLPDFGRRARGLPEAAPADLTPKHPRSDEDEASACHSRINPHAALSH